MSDRELMGLAARAAGAYWVGAYNCWRINDKSWWPLDDDGDALRLAVQMGIDVHTGDTFGHGGAGFTTADCFRFGTIISMQVPHGDDAMAATRRAIVRAAAAIGAKGEM